jgi:hypothetical protein
VAGTDRSGRLDARYVGESVLDRSGYWTRCGGRAVDPFHILSREWSDSGKG